MLCFHYLFDRALERESWPLKRPVGLLQHIKRVRSLQVMYYLEICILLGLLVLRVLIPIHVRCPDHYCMNCDHVSFNTPTSSMCTSGAQIRSCRVINVFYVYISHFALLAFVYHEYLIFLLRTFLLTIRRTPFPTYITTKIWSEASSDIPIG